MSTISVLICSAVHPTSSTSRHAQTLQQSLVLLEWIIHHVHSSKCASTSVNLIRSPFSSALCTSLRDQHPSRRWQHLCAARFRRARSCAAARILKFHAIFEFYLCVACWKPMCLVWLWSGVPDWSTQRIGFWSTLWLLRDLSRKWAVGTICKRLKWTMSGLVLWMRHLMWAHLPFLRGHAAAGCHFSTTQILKLKKSQKTSCLGLNQVCYCSCFLNTWRDTAASVGLDLDSLALWFGLLNFGHRFGQDPI